jgi:hypothetical protein
MVNAIETLPGKANNNPERPIFLTLSKNFSLHFMRYQFDQESM